MPPGGDFDAFISTRVVGGIELRRLTRQLKDLQRRDLSRRLRAKIRQATNPVIRDLRTAVMNVEVTALPPGRAGGARRWARPEHELRRRVAAAITTSITANGVRIKVSANRIGPYGSSLAKYLDAEITQYRRWRHPVYGHDVWVLQRGQPWFFATISDRANDLERAVLEAVDEIKRELSD